MSSRTSLIVRILQYSFTISLGFPTLLTLVVLGAIVMSLVIRNKYMANYAELKEPALPPPSPPALTNELLPLTGGVLNDPRDRTGAFHNYLDEFLSAIRIFGYLEKPVFHELSRHLQTRRLAAGDTLEIGGGDFWCVVDGNVQVVSWGAISDERVMGTSLTEVCAFYGLCPAITRDPPSTLFQRVSSPERGINRRHPLLALRHSFALHRRYQAFMDPARRGIRRRR